VLSELRVSNLGVIDEVTIVLGPGMTALTGETGAGKTLIVDAIGLLLGGSADPMIVRPGAAEAAVEGRFVAADGSETILSRVVPVAGRSRSYVGGRMASASQLAEAGAAFVDMHGQHAHQTLLRPAVQRSMLDRFGGIDVSEVQTIRQGIRLVAESQAEIGGDARNRAREIDLLRFQLTELEGAGLESAAEDDLLKLEEERLGDASALREASARLSDALAGEDGVEDRLGALLSLVSGKAALGVLSERLEGVNQEIADIAREARRASELFEDDPQRLAEVGARRQVLTELRRKYGETLAEVMSYRDGVKERLEQLESFESRAADLEERRAQLAEKLAEAELRIRDARRSAAPALSAAVQARLRELAMPRATFEVEVDGSPPGDAVTWKLGANPGEAVLALGKVASGGELARTMLAARLAVGAGRPGSDDETTGPSTLVFDEVDAGIGGEAATAVGRALASLADTYQVLVVTHLPQVAAFADRHLVVTKTTKGDRTIADVVVADGEERVVEVSRMLSGSPRSETARRHAEELLASAGRDPDPQRPTVRSHR
jgi:DNA repair protein RecN (Recombination protein N)